MLRLASDCTYPVSPGRGCHQPEEGEEDGEEKVVLGHPLVGGGDRGEEVRGVYNPGIHGHRARGWVCYLS